MGGAIAGIQAARAELAERRAALDAQIGALESALRTMGAGVGGAVRRGPGRPPGSSGGNGRRGRRGGRGPRAGSLKEYILKVLGGGGVMRVKDIASGVLSAGFRSKNQTLAKSVGVALRDLQGVKQVGRGQFRRA
jgi:hypothetical protein